MAALTVGAIRLVLFLSLTKSIFCFAYSSPFLNARKVPALHSRQLQTAAFTTRVALDSRRGENTVGATKLSLSNHNESSDTKGGDTMNPVTKASWYAAEALGKIFAPDKNDKKSSKNTFDESIDLNQPPKSLDEALRRIQLDNDRSYFLSGEVDVQAYDPNCVFSDPFVSFAGRDRFVENLANLGSFITKYDAKMLGYDVENEGSRVKTKVMVKLELNLPWKPVLAWPWGVTYDIDPQTLLVTNHAESWDIEPWEGVKQVFRKPTVTIRGSQGTDDT